MNSSEYQRLAARTLNKEAVELTPEQTRLVNAVLGLFGESGEVAEHIKAHLFHGKSLDKEYLFKELGDVAWYLAATCTLLDLSLSDVLDENIYKLEKRYPNGFSVEASLNRTE